MKRILIVLVAILICIPFISFAQEPLDESKITAESAMLIDAVTGNVLFEKNKDARIKPASTTKLMTVLLTVENTKLEDIVTTGDEVNKFTSSSSLAGIKKGEQITVKDLLYGALLPSGNDAAAALAVHIGGSISGFNDMMNAKAKELGMENTHFSNPHGLNVQNQEHYSTAADMAKLASEVYAHPELMEITKTTNYTINPTNIVKEPRALKTTNILLLTPNGRPDYAKYLYPYATGMKSGLLESPFYACLVASANKDGLELISLVFGDTSTTEGINRWQMVIDMFDYGFSSFSKVDLNNYIIPLSIEKTVENCAKNDESGGQLMLNADIDFAATSEVYLTPATTQGLSEGTVKIEEETVLTKPMVAPIANGEEMGYVVYKLNGEEILKAPLLASRKVYQIGEESLVKNALAFPEFEFNPIYLLFIIIPAAVVFAFFIIKANINRPRRRRLYSQEYARHGSAPVSRKVTTYDYGMLNDTEKKRPSNYAQKALRGRKR